MEKYTKYTKFIEVKKEEVDRYGRGYQNSDTYINHWLCGEMPVADAKPDTVYTCNVYDEGYGYTTNTYTEYIPVYSESKDRYWNLRQIAFIALAYELDLDNFTMYRIHSNFLKRKRINLGDIRHEMYRLKTHKTYIPLFKECKIKNETKL